MKSNCRHMALKLALSFIACIGLWSQLALASSIEDVSTLVNLFDEKGISISTNPSALLDDRRVVVMSRGQLTDLQVSVYSDKYNSLPLVLPLTTKLLDDTLGDDDTLQQRDKLFAAALMQGSIIYLYINPSHFKNSANNLSDLLTPLLESDFQDKLKDSRFAATPAEYMQQWAVSLGNAEPEYTGGYK